MAFVKLHDAILQSSIIEEPLTVRWVWICMLLFCDKEGNIYGTLPSLARRSNIDLAEFECAMDVLMNPDSGSTSPNEEGRRVIQVGSNLWHCVNYLHYRGLRDPIEEREKTAARVRKHRAKKKAECNPGNKNVTETNDIAEAYEHKSIEADHISVFSDWWTRWPTGRKIDKAKCMRFFDRLNKTDQENAAGPAYLAWLDHWTTIDIKFIPHPYTWLNNRRWEADPPAKKPAVTTTHQTATEVVDAIIEHRKSCDSALEIVANVIITCDQIEPLLKELDKLHEVIAEAKDLAPGNGYQKIVEAEDLFLDWVADGYDIDAPTATGRRNLARKRLDLPVLY